MRSLLLVLLVMTGALSTILTTAACSSVGETSCECVDPTISIHIPGDRAAAASKPALSGACAGAALVCNQQATGGGCTLWQFAPSKAGPSCAIDIDFATGTTFHTDIQIVQETGCCSGFYAQPISAADVEVPAG